MPPSLRCERIYRPGTHCSGRSLFPRKHCVPKQPVQVFTMDASTTKSDQDKSNESATVEENKQPKDVEVNAEEVNGTAGGTRLTEEMLEYYYQRSKEEKYHRRRYEEAAYWVYGTIPSEADPVKFRAKMTNLQKKKLNPDA